MRIQDVIAKKRDGGVLTNEEIAFFVAGYTSGNGVTDYQAAALLMAIYLRGMNPAETASLTSAMAASGRRIDLADVLPADVPTLDKHSTGGVGDKATLIVVPILVAAGIAVCKMSGRGLGHTGGTLDKLESIPGFRTSLTIDEMTAQVAQIGGCIAGQTAELAPADRKLYALRDATATVASLPLIVGSILSKKLAGGAESFVFDVKFGGGALLRERVDAEALAAALIAGASANGRRAVAVLSDMSQPLGRAVGNALEVAEAVAQLTSAPDVDGRLLSLCLRLAAEGLVLTGKASTRDAGEATAAAILDSGAARDAFRSIVSAQGGDARVVGDPWTVLPRSPVVREVRASRAGYVAAVDAEAVGRIVVALGGGRASKDDAIDPAVGIVILAPVGAHVTSGAPLAEIHARSDDDADSVTATLATSFRVADVAVAPPTLF